MNLQELYDKLESGVIYITKAERKDKIGNQRRVYQFILSDGAVYCGTMDNLELTQEPTENTFKPHVIVEIRYNLKEQQHEK